MKSFLFLLVLLSHFLFSAKAETNRFFIDENQVNHYTGEGDYPFDPEKIEATKTAKDSRPASEDPEGNWGTPNEGFQLSLRFEKQTYEVGEPISAVVIFRNISDKSLKYPVTVPDVDTQIILVDDQMQTVPNKTQVNSNGSFQEKLKHLQRGSEATLFSPVSGQRRFLVNLTENFDLKPGQYLVYAKRRIFKLNSIEETEIASANATIQIVRANSNALQNNQQGNPDETASLPAENESFNARPNKSSAQFPQATKVRLRKDCIGRGKKTYSYKPTTCIFVN